MKIVRNVLIVLVLIAGGGVLGWQATSNGWITYITGVQQNEASLSSGDQVDLSLFWTVWGLVEKQYVDQDAIDRQKMIYGSIKGMVSSLGDPYSVFMNPEETTEFTKDLDSELDGIGAQLSIENENLVVVTPLKGSPAEKAGIKPGDIIYKIGDKMASDLTLFDAIKTIRGEIGTPITLSIIRKGVEKSFDVTIIRAKIDVESVTKKVLDNGIIYLSINQFSDKTSDEFGNAIDDLILKEPKGLIIDLRYNGGGYLDIAVQILSYLLDTDLPAVSIHERNKADDETIRTEGGKKLLNIPLVVLVNEGSASASEIVAGAVQDHKRGIIMGTQSFGKGTVQEVEYLKDGSSLRLTIAKWLTSNGRVIQKVGITPNIVVENYEDDVKNGVDRQLDEAIKYLENLKK